MIGSRETAEYSTTIDVAAPLEAVFRFVSSIDNLPRYLPTVHTAKPQGGQRVEVDGEANGRHYHSDGWFRIDNAAHAVRWGSDGENDYRGEMRLSEKGGGTHVACHIHFNPRPDEATSMREHQGGADAVMQDGLESALQSIKRICEGSGGKQPSSAER